jgi:hypothetical protein
MKNPQILQADRFTAAVILVLMFMVILMTSSCGEEETVEPTKPETSTMVDVDRQPMVDGREPESYTLPQR